MGKKKIISAPRKGKKTKPGQVDDSGSDRGRDRQTELEKAIEAIEDITPSATEKYVFGK